eukprot:3496551-Lingulodinium_polyedra.AAC.1
MGAWVAERLSFQSFHGEAWQAQKNELWETLGLDPESIATLTYTLEYDFKDGRLWVLETVADCPDLVLVKWRESRWLTVGSSSRTVVASLLLGLADEV